MITIVSVEHDAFYEKKTSPLGEISTEASESNFWRKGHKCYPQIFLQWIGYTPLRHHHHHPQPPLLDHFHRSTSVLIKQQSSFTYNFFNPTRSHRFDFYQTRFDCTLFLWQLILPVDFLVVYYQLKCAKPLNRFEKCRDSSVEIGNRKRTSVLKFRRHLLYISLSLSPSLSFSHGLA